MTFVANKNKVFIKQLPPETHTASGLVIPDNVQKSQLYGIVVNVGPYNKAKYGELSIGDKVSFSAYAGEQSKDFGDGILMVKPEDIYSVMSSDTHFAFGPSVIVEIEKRYNDEIELSTGQKLHYDPMYKPTENLTYSGTVTSVPTITPYNEQLQEIDPVINIGDKVYFRYIAVDDDINLLGKSVTDTSETLTVRVFYSWIYAVSKQGEVQAVGEWVLAKPFIDADGVEETIQGESGPVTIKVEYFPGSTLVKSTYTEKSIYKAIVEYSSTLRNIPESIQKGDIVFSRYRIDFANTIEGTEYYCIRKSSIDAIVGNKCDKCKNCQCKP